ncbi:MAG TPA: hypothetical protein VE132_15920 [Micromonosporaceae bacterium]|nr:hypothetical protein [Micromonosporaceae bacterium]
MTNEQPNVILDVVRDDSDRRVDRRPDQMSAGRVEPRLYVFALAEAARVLRTDANTRAAVDTIRARAGATIRGAISPLDRGAAA